MEQAISKNYHPSRHHADDVVVVESYLRATRAILDNTLSLQALSELRGAEMVLHTYLDVRGEILNSSKVEKHE